MADKAAYQWFKMWHDARNDAKLNALTDQQYRIWHRLLIFASEQVDNRGAILGYDDELIAIEVAFGDVEAFIATIERLIKLRILERIDDGYQFTKFNKRQADVRKPSDEPEAVRTRKQASRARQRDIQDSDAELHAEETVSRAVTPLSRPCHAPVTPRHAQEVDEDGDAEREGEQEAEQDPSADVAAVVAQRARARAATAASAITSVNASSGGDAGVIALCERIAQRTHLPQRVEVMEQLTAVLQSHLTRGLSPGDIERDVLNLIDPSRPKHVKRPSVTQISNWLAHTHPAENLAAVAVGGANGAGQRNGHTPLPAAAAARGDRSHDHYTTTFRGRRQPDLPDPTRNGRYAGLVTVASDDGPDDDA